MNDNNNNNIHIDIIIINYDNMRTSKTASERLKQSLLNHRL